VFIEIFESIYKKLLPRVKERKTLDVTFDRQYATLALG